ncbi:MAG: insulinase family protein [Candidatus Improbicoccus pseudotrichonymphae]|uniref:Insulinase family protein n=1 Tax=Candidatus Improbicoccus pseudotrichonymphae TaxID=3033792 RepID=A0AA48HUF5_9FIRM|nr:MAG: insulinase family protein [Candidatus Improbicoccus pseudotrichonymphae]
MILQKERFFEKRLNEEYFFVEHSSGLKIYLFPKKNYNSTYAIFGTKYGSINEMFKTSENKIIKTPSGVAHYLEHKLFENEDCDVFSLFNKTGASANAYTSFDKTAYLFLCNNNFIESLKILLSFVQNPYFTKQNVDKEREIINQEIKMYRDDPESRVNHNLLKNLYLKHTIRQEIAGTVESVAKITPEILYECYNNFYNLKNMCLCVSGRFDVDETLDCIFRCLKNQNDFNLAEDFFEEEPDVIGSDYVRESMEVAMPVFNLGFKEKIDRKYSSMKDVIISEIILCALTFKSEKIYNELINNNLINISSFSCENFSGPYYSSFIFSGESDKVLQASETIKKNIRNIVNFGLSNDTFERAKKCVYAESVSALNSVSGIANNLLDFSFFNYEIFEYINKISDIDLKDVNGKIEQKFREDFSVLSVIDNN